MLAAFEVAMPSLKSWFSSGSIYFEIKLFICGINNSMHLNLLQVIHLSQNMSFICHSFVVLIITLFFLSSWYWSLTSWKAISPRL